MPLINLVIALIVIGFGLYLINRVTVQVVGRANRNRREWTTAQNICDSKCFGHDDSPASSFQIRTARGAKS